MQSYAWAYHTMFVRIHTLIKTKYLSNQMIKSSKDMFVEITVTYHDAIMGKSHEQYGASLTVDGHKRWTAP